MRQIWAHVWLRVTAPPQRLGTTRRILGQSWSTSVRWTKLDAQVSLQLSENVLRWDSRKGRLLDQGVPNQY